MMVGLRGALCGRLNTQEKVEFRVSIPFQTMISIFTFQVSTWFDTGMNAYPQQIGKNKDQDCN